MIGLYTLPFILSTTYTPSLATIVYKSHNVNTHQITIKINPHNPPQLLPTPPKPTSYLLNFIMTTLCSSVIIIIVHDNIIIVTPSLFSLRTYYHK